MICLFQSPAAARQEVSCKAETLKTTEVNPIEDLIDYDPVEKTVMFGPMAIWKWVVRRMNSDKPVRV